MGRAPRNSQGGYVYHVIGRGLKPKPMFRSIEDYQDFDSILARAVERFEPRLLAYCVIPKHWHLVLTPRKDGDLSKFMAWLTTTHSARWHTKPKRGDSGGIYERRFRSFPVQDNAQLLDVLRFVESHPIRAGLVEALSDWPWLSSSRRVQEPDAAWPLLSIPPVPFPSDWNEQLSSEMPLETLDRINHSIHRSCPYGAPEWVQKTAVRLGIESTIRPRGRPKKATP
ncbi:MAG: transposase [Planctomycetota bacterium]|nr:transposase [Planctomycetota bacterium]